MRPTIGLRATSNLIGGPATSATTPNSVFAVVCGLIRKCLFSRDRYGWGEPRGSSIDPITAVHLNKLDKPDTEKTKSVAMEADSTTIFVNVITHECCHVTTQPNKAYKMDKSFPSRRGTWIMQPTLESHSNGGGVGPFRVKKIPNLNWMGRVARVHRNYIKDIQIPGF